MFKRKNTNSRQQSPVEICLDLFKGSNHRETAAKYSYFEKNKFNVRDIIFFIMDYLNELMLYRCKILANMSSQSTPVNYAQFIRDIMSQKMCNVMNTVLLNGEIEIDESAFGCVRKYRLGNLVAPQMWIFGLVWLRRLSKTRHKVYSRNCFNFW